ncbi:MAG: tRNA 2-selenouridine(34) synthase MnmH [Cellulosilyticaceae bacterium]
MQKTTLTNDFRAIVLNETPLIDVRAPIEYIKGAFIGSVNLPIMNDEERHLVGTCYKEHGNAKATELGYRLVSGSVQEARIEAWKNFMAIHPDALLYCFRGGSRSRISQEWLCEALDRDILRLEGGYKAFRNYLMEALEPENITSKPIILGGYTGSGKTLLLRKLENAIDLEAIANHRGSSFGKHMTPQPTQINFENNLAYKLIQHQAKGYSHMILEDEGRHIGTSYIPKELYAYFNAGGLVVIDVPLETRIQITLEEYVVEAQSEYIQGSPDAQAGLNAWLEYIHSSILRVKKRLGGDRYKELIDLVNVAFDHQVDTGDISKHMAWIEVFLKDYYDPMYQYQLDTTTKDIIFRGSESEVFAYLQAQK